MARFSAKTKPTFQEEYDRLLSDNAAWKTWLKENSQKAYAKTLEKRKAIKIHKGQWGKDQQHRGRGSLVGFDGRGLQKELSPRHEQAAAKRSQKAMPKPVKYWPKGIALRMEQMRQLWKDAERERKKHGLPEPEKVVAQPKRTRRQIREAKRAAARDAQTRDIQFSTSTGRTAYGRRAR